MQYLNYIYATFLLIGHETIIQLKDFINVFQSRNFHTGPLFIDSKIHLSFDKPFLAKLQDLLTPFFNRCSNFFLITTYPIPNDLKSFLVCKFTCASCSSSYIGETCRHFKTRIEEHIKKDNKSHIFKHLHSTTTCFDSYNSLCFKITDKANSEFDLKIKEALNFN